MEEESSRPTRKHEDPDAEKFRRCTGVSETTRKNRHIAEFGGSERTGKSSASLLTSETWWVDAWICGCLDWRAGADTVITHRLPVGRRTGHHAAGEFATLRGANSLHEFPGAPQC